MAKNQVRIGVGVDDKATKPIAGIRDAFNRLQKQGGKGFAIGAGAAITAKGFSLLDSAASAVIGTLGDSVAAYREDQVSVSKLNQALLANVKGWNGNTDAIEQNLKAGMKLGFADELQRDALVGLVAAYGDEQQALKSLALAQNIARFSGMGLVEASDLLVKVHAGSYRALKSLGIETKGVKNETQALGLIYDKVKGQAAAYAKTSQGKVEAANVAIAEAQEKAGKVLDQFWGHFAEIAARALDSEYNAEVEYADARVELEGKTSDELLAIIREHVWKTSALRRQVLADIILRARAETDASKEVTSAYNAIEEARVSATRSLVETGDAMDNTTEDAKQLKTAFEKVSEAAGQMDDALRKLDEALYGPAILAGDLAQAQKDLNEVLKDRPESKKAADIAIWNGKVAEAQKAVFDLQYQMAQSAGPSAFYDWLVNQEKVIGSTNPKLADYISHLKALALLSGQAVPTGGGLPVPVLPRTGQQRAFASGGFLPTGGTGTVGEEGIERIRSVPGGTVITPTSQTKTGGGVTNIINLTIQGDVRAPDKEAIVRELIRASGFLRG